MYLVFIYKVKHIKTMIEDIREDIDKVKNFNQFTNKEKLNEDNMFGIINISVDGDFKYKHQVVNGIRKVLSQYMGERHLFVDGKEVNPYSEIMRGGF